MDLSGLSLEQLRTFAAVVDEGSFSGAGRRLRRGQSAITYLVQRLEDQVGAPLFDRSGYRARLTDAGRALLPRAQRVLEAATAFQSQARALTRGIEPELAIVVDAMFPMGILFKALSKFESDFPTVQTRIFVESMGSTVDLVLDRTADLGFVVTSGSQSDQLVSHPSVDIELIRVAAPGHPLALLQRDQARELDAEDFGDRLQLVLTDRTQRTGGQDRGVFSNRTWRLADLGAKQAMLLAGLGWGSMPAHMVEADLAAGRLVELRASAAVDTQPRSSIATAMVRRRDRALGPAGQSFFASMTNEAAPTLDRSSRTLPSERKMPRAEVEP